MQEKIAQESEIQAQDKAQEPTVEIVETVDTVNTDDDLATQVQELTEENELLFEQLHIVQEELEKYYYKLKDAKKYDSPSSTSVANNNAHLQALVNVYSSLRKAETTHSLQYRVGDAMLKLSKSPLKAIFSFFPTIAYFLQSTPPAQWGGKSFTKIIEAYEKDGKDGVKKLINSAKTTSIIKANAFTALAKHLQRKNLADCCSYASQAYKADPQAYRMKWWILRLDDRGDYITAGALAQLLPADTPMNASEKSKIESVRNGFKNFAQTGTMTPQKKNAPAPANSKQLDDIKAQLASRNKEVEQLKREKILLEGRHQEQATLIASKEEVLELTKEKLNKAKKKNKKYIKEVAHLQGALEQAEKTANIE